MYTREAASLTKQKFSELAFATPEIRNCKKLKEYLDFLVNDLGWLEVREEVKKSPYNPRRTRPIARWKVSYYYLTDKGSTFLSLFPSAEEEEIDNDEGELTEELRLEKKQEAGIKRPVLYTVRGILEEAEGGVFNFSDLAKIAEGASNRKNLSGYLKLLRDELCWVGRKKRI